MATEKKTTTVPDDLPPVVMTKFGILIEWYCMAVTLSDSEAMAFVRGVAPNPGDTTRADRFYGGFPCERADRRHVCHDAGAYTYLGENVPLTDAERAERYAEIVREVAKGDAATHYVGGGPFVSGAPS